MGGINHLSHFVTADCIELACCQTENTSFIIAIRVSYRFFKPWQCRTGFNRYLVCCFTSSTSPAQRPLQVQVTVFIVNTHAKIFCLQQVSLVQSAVELKEMLLSSFLESGPLKTLFIVLLTHDPLSLKRFTQ